MNPILVAGPPRCGTSMIAGLIAHHGVQVGEYGVNPENPKGGFENRAAKDAMKQSLRENGYGLNPIHCDPDHFEPDTTWKGRIEAGIPDPSKRWLVKEFRILMTWPLWASYFPQAVYVLPRRPFADNLASMTVHSSIRKKGTREQLADWIKWAHRRQETIAASCPHVWVDADKLWAGDMAYAGAFVERLGLEFDEARARAWIDPALRHWRQGPLREGVA